MKLTVAEAAGGGEVGVCAPAVCVCITAAISTAIVPTTSTGAAVACGAHAARVTVTAQKTPRVKFVFNKEITYFAFFSTFAHVSLRFTVKLNTGFSGADSLSTQK